MILDGRAIALGIENTLTETIRCEHLKPGLGIVLVGHDRSSLIYVERKSAAAKRVGIDVHLSRFEEHTEEADIQKAVEAFNRDRHIHGILVQLPLPPHIQTDTIIASIRPEKDADGFHPKNVQAFLHGDRSHWPVMTRVIWTLLTSTNVPLSGMHACILANTPTIFAPPIRAALADANVTCVAHRPDHPDTLTAIASADIVISAVGRPQWIKPAMIKPGAILIDIGITQTVDGLQGDMDPTCDAVASWQTPVPGGVGPVTVATLLENVVTLAKRTS